MNEKVKQMLLNRRQAAVTVSGLLFTTATPFSALSQISPAIAGRSRELQQLLQEATAMVWPCPGRLGARA